MQDTSKTIVNAFVVHKKFVLRASSGHIACLMPFVIPDVSIAPSWNAPLVFIRFPASVNAMLFAASVRPCQTMPVLFHTMKLKARVYGRAIQVLLNFPPAVLPPIRTILK